MPRLPRPAARLAAGFVAGLVAGAGCASSPPPDGGWAPLASAAEEAELAGGLPPLADARAQVPRFETRAQRLPSGLRVAVESAPTPGLVAVVLSIGSGSASDPPGKEGLAHLVEHLVFRGRGRGDVPQRDRLVRAGAQYNASTGPDTTTFHELAPRAALPALLAIADERLADPLAGLSEEDFLKERAIVENELRERNELGVRGLVVGWMQAALFDPGSRYHRPVGGSEASLGRITLADARAYAAAHYRPEAASLFVTTPEPLPAAWTAVTERLRARGPVGRPAAPAPAVGPAAPPRAAAPDRLEAAVARPEIWLAYRLPSLHGPEGAAVRVLTSRAGADEVRRLLLQDDAVLGAEMHVLPFAHATVVAWEIALAGPRRRARVADRARRIVWSVWADEGPPAAVAWSGWRKGGVLSVRRASIAATLLAAEPFSERALTRAETFHVTDVPSAYEETLGRIAALDEAAVSGAAFELLAPERARTLFVEPPAEGAPGAQAPSGPRAPVAERRAPAPVSSSAPGASGSSAASPPPPQLPPPDEATAARTQTLANGLTVVVLPRRGFPSVTAMLGFAGGEAALPAGLLRLVRAVESRSGPDSDQRAELGTQPFDGPDTTADAVVTTPGNLARALYLLAYRLKSLALADWDALLSRGGRGAASPAVAEEPSALAHEGLLEALHGAHPYARRSTWRDALALPPEVPRAWLPHLYRPRGAVLVIAGAVDPEEAMRLADTWFGAWRPQVEAEAPAAPPVEPPPAPAPPLRIWHRPVKSQVAVTLGCPLPAARSPEERLAQRAAAAAFAARLDRRLREEEGAAYGISGEAVTLARAGHLVFHGAVDVRALARSLAVVRAEARGAAQGLDGALLAQVRGALVRQSALARQTSLAVAGAALADELAGWGVAAGAREGELAAALPEEGVRRALAVCLERASIALVGDREGIRRALE